VLGSASNLFDIVRKLEQSLKKYYIVHCVQSGKNDKCKEFFEQFADELSRDREWKDWFGTFVLFGFVLWFLIAAIF